MKISRGSGLSKLTQLPNGRNGLALRSVDHRHKVTLALPVSLAQLTVFLPAAKTLRHPRRNWHMEQASSADHAWGQHTTRNIIVCFLPLTPYKMRAVLDPRLSNGTGAPAD